VVLSRTRELLQFGLEKMAGVHDAIVEDEAALFGVEAQHIAVSGSINSAQALMLRLKRREYRRRVKIIITVIFFYIAVFYVTKHRLPVNEIVSALPTFGCIASVSKRRTLSYFLRFEVPRS